MKRILVLEGPKAARRFQLLWSAMVSPAEGKGDRPPAVIRKEARMLDLLEAISIPLPTNGVEPEPRDLREPTTLTVTQEDFELLQTYTEKTQWNPRFSRDVVDVWDFLSACPKEE